MDSNKTKYFDPANGAAQPEGYTIWICELGSDGAPAGTHHVSYHQGAQGEAVTEAKTQTALDWYSDDSPEFLEPLHVLGVALGNVHIMEWDEGA